MSRFIIDLYDEIEVADFNILMASCNDKCNCDCHGRGCDCITD